MKLMEKMRQKRLGNKGFTLIELIIVIAIMAVLLGLVGTQVIPYLQRSREAKDLQIINSYCTAAVTSYASHAEAFATFEAAPSTIYFTVYDNSSTPTVTGAIALTETTGVKLSDMRIWVKDLVGYSAIGNLTAKMTSDKGKDITDVRITIDFSDKTVTAQAYNGATPVFDPVVSYI